MHSCPSLMQGNFLSPDRPSQCLPNAFPRVKEPKFGFFTSPRIETGIKDFILNFTLLVIGSWSEHSLRKRISVHGGGVHFQWLGFFLSFNYKGDIYKHICSFTRFWRFFVGGI